MVFRVKWARFYWSSADISRWRLQFYILLQLHFLQIFKPKVLIIVSKITKSWSWGIFYNSRWSLNYWQIMILVLTWQKITIFVWEKKDSYDIPKSPILTEGEISPLWPMSAILYMWPDQPADVLKISFSGKLSSGQTFYYFMAGSLYWLFLLQNT